ncbi:MAG: LLM class flavin-dependent oxidoreductase [bacterium]|nr:LLM class flavin-dependent oxidoreductase [bacterium]MCY4136627.1 LLM class flavin-dependent oxidoreductase [bacterium]
MRLAFKTRPQNIEWPVMLETWRELDANPRYESAWLFDHFYPIYGSEEGPCLEAWVALSALAQATSRIRIGTMVNAAPTAILYPFSLIDPASVHDMADALESLVDTG